MSSSSDIIKSLIPTIKKKIIGETPYDTVINFVEGKDNEYKYDIFDTSDPVKHEQYKFIVKYMGSIYNTIKEKEFANVFEQKANNESKTKYLDNLLILYIKEYLLGDITDKDIDSLKLINVNFDDGTNMFSRFNYILTEYFLKKINKTAFKDNDIIKNTSNLEKGEDKQIDIYENQLLDSNKYNKFIKIAECIKNKSLLNDQIYSFSDNQYVIDKNFGIDNTVIVENDNKFVSYKLTNHADISSYLYSRLRYLKTLGSNNPDNEVIEEFKNMFGTIEKDKANLDESNIGNTDDTLQNQLIIILNSLKNRADVLQYNNNLKEIVIYKGYLSKGVIVYYNDLLNAIYDKYIDIKNNITKRIGFFNSFVCSIIFYRSIFNNLFKIMKDNDLLNITNLNSYLLKKDKFLTMFFIEMKPFLDGYKRTDVARQIKLFVNINDNDNEFNLLESKQQKIIGLTPEKRIFQRKDDKTLSINKKPISKNLNFNKVFDNTSTPSVMASFMSISNSLNNLEGTILYTFGASGVGKTFTLFGKNEKPGLIQSTLISLSSVKSLKIKVYEIYGIGFNDLEYWNKENIYEKYIVHNLTYNRKAFSCSKSDVLSFDEFTDPVNNKQLTLTSNQIFEAQFSSLIDTIDGIRKKGINFGDNNIIQTIKPTANNPESSRSILVYEFLVQKEISKNKIVEIPLILIDMPGKELIKNTYNCSAAPKLCKITTDSKGICTDSNDYFKTELGYKVINGLYNIYKELENTSFINKISLTNVIDKKQITIANYNKNLLDSYLVFYYEYIKYKNVNDGIPPMLYSFGGGDDHKCKGIIEIYNIKRKANKNKMQAVDKKDKVKYEKELAKYNDTKNNIAKQAQEIKDIFLNKIEPDLIKVISSFYEYMITVGIKAKNDKNLNQMMTSESKENYIINEVTKYTSKDKGDKNLISEKRRNLITNYKKDLNRANDILKIEISVCQKNNADYKILPDNLCLNIKSIISDREKTFDTGIQEEQLKQELLKNYVPNKYNNISTILANYTSDYYVPPYGLYDENMPSEKKQMLKKYFDQILEGIYINENINSIQKYMLNKTSPADTTTIPIKKTEGDYDEKELFSKNLIIQKLFDYYDIDSNVNKAKIENYICFYLCANISSNDRLQTALFNNSTLPIDRDHYYFEEMNKTQIVMYEDFSSIIKALYS